MQAIGEIVVGGQIEWFWEEGDTNDNHILDRKDAFTYLLVTW